MNSEMFDRLPIRELFIRCAVPAAITSVFGALYSIVDGLFVGKYLGENALAAVNLIMPVIMIVEALSNMVATGASVNISMLLGSGRRKEASKVFSFSVRFILMLSVLIGAAGFLFAERFVSFIALGASRLAIENATGYLKVYSLFAPLVPIYFATDNYLRVCGKQKLSMVISISTQILNAILDFIFIVVLKYGICSAAVASCASIALGSIITLGIFMNGRLDIYFTRGGIKLKQFIGILFNGSSEFFGSIATSVMSLVMNLFLLKYGQTTAVAAFSIVMYVDSIIGMLNFGICDSLQPAISYCYGAGHPDRLRKILKSVITAIILISALSFAFMFFAGPYVSRLFIKREDIELLAMSATATRIFAFSYITGWIDMCFSSFFTALDCPKQSFLITLFGTLVFPIFFLFVLTEFWQLNGVWMMAPVSATVSAVVTLFMARTLDNGQ